MGTMFGTGRAYQNGCFTHNLKRTALKRAVLRFTVFLHMGFACAYATCLTASATLVTADTTTENFTPQLNIHGSCHENVDILSNGNTAGTDGYCPLGNQTSYAITFGFTNPTETDYMDSISFWPNSGSIYSDLELRTLNIQVFYINEATGALQSLTMNNVILGDPQSANDPQSVMLTDALGTPVQLKQVQSVTISNLRNNMGDTNETPVREVQFNVFAPPPGTLTANKTVAMKNTGDYAIPGSDIIYTLDVYNNGGTYISNNSIFLVDSLPDDFEFFIGDFDGDGPAVSPVYFTETNSGLSFNYGSDFGFSGADAKPTQFSDCNYTPTFGYNQGIKYVCFKPQGAMVGERDPNQPTPHFQFSFGGRVK